MIVKKVNLAKKNFTKVAVYMPTPNGVAKAPKSAK